MSNYEERRRVVDCREQIQEDIMSYMTMQENSKYLVLPEEMTDDLCQIVVDGFKKLEEWSRSNPDQIPIRNYIEQQRKNRGKTARRRKRNSLRFPFPNGTEKANRSQRRPSCEADPQSSRLLLPMIPKPTWCQPMVNP